MIEVIIKLNVHGLRKKEKLLGFIAIANDDKGTRKLGNYDYAISHAGIYLGKRKEPFKKGKIKNFPRHLSPYRLVARVLKDARET